MLFKYIKLVIFLVCLIIYTIFLINPIFIYDDNKTKYIDIYLNDKLINIENGSTFKDLLLNQTLELNKQYDISLDYVLKNNETIYIDNNENKISINKADISQLITLPGIGEKTAYKIIEYRNNYGEFKHINELKNVKGIGDKKYEKIKELITI